MNNGFSPWVFTTYACSCKCHYCMVPKIGNESMSSETFEKMLQVTERIFDKGTYESASFRLSGGEPFIVWSKYKDLVSKYHKKHGQKMTFGVLSNLTVLTDDMIEWMKENDIGVQVSLDDLENSKPMVDGGSSAPVVLKNIDRLRDAKVNFSINTVYDYEYATSLKKLAEYVASINPNQWGLSASYTLNDDSHLEQIMDTIKLSILHLRDCGFDVRNKLRFYNEIINQPGKTCQAGCGLFALGTNLEVFPCQQLIDKNPLGIFDENIKELLATAEANEYFRNRTLLPECTDCSVLQWCRGGCRVIHQSDQKAVEITCKIKQEVINFILKNTFQQQQFSNNCNCESNNWFDKLLQDYVAGNKEPVYVDTPSID